jgi:hypothetical protein
MTTTEDTPRTVSHYNWAITFQTPGHDPAEVKGTMTSIATQAEDARALLAAAERIFRRRYLDQDGPVSVLSFSLEPES